MEGVFSWPGQNFYYGDRYATEVESQDKAERLVSNIQKDIFEKYQEAGYRDVFMTGEGENLRVKDTGIVNLFLENFIFDNSFDRNYVDVEIEVNQTDS